jgi:predicted transcriptional regulator
MRALPAWAERPEEDVKERAHSIQIDDLMTRNPTTTTPDSTLESAARRMWTENRAFLPVIDSTGHVVVGFLVIRSSIWME